VNPEDDQATHLDPDTPLDACASREFVRPEDSARRPPDSGEWLADRSLARGYYARERGHGDSYGWYAIEWLSSAAASGIIGNIAYATIQSILRKIKREAGKEESIGANPDGQEHVDLVAKLAVQEHCRNHALPVPKLDELRVASNRPYGDLSSEWRCQVEASNLYAEVVVHAYWDIFTQSIAIAMRIKD
jgi:hypothetical protein